MPFEQVRADHVQPAPAAAAPGGREVLQHLIHDAGRHALVVHSLFYAGLEAVSLVVGKGRVVIENGHEHHGVLREGLNPAKCSDGNHSELLSELTSIVRTAGVTAHEQGQGHVIAFSTRP
ncbi:hypothetical protein [Deinococcus ficus]|uniref:hypothetical protein n=1 Tax=Deinococcus ficus TaxID=317577 RepID=UPI0030844547